MSTAWVIVIACLWVLVLGLVVVVAATLRRVAAVLGTQAALGPSPARRIGPVSGSVLPPIAVIDAGRRRVVLSDLTGPFVLAVLTSRCAPCLAIADWLRAHSARLREADRLVVLTDSGGRAVINLDAVASVLADDENASVFHALQVPGTPFAVSVGADGRVSSSSLLSGPDHLLGMLEALRQDGTAELRIQTVG